MYYDFLKREILRGKNINHPLEEIERCQIGGTNVTGRDGTEMGVY